MNAFLFDLFIPQLVKNLGLQVRDIGNSRVVCKDLEGSHMNAWTDLDTSDPCMIQTVRQSHGIPLRSLTEKVLIGDIQIGVLESLFVRQQIVDRSSALAQDLFVLQLPANDNQCLLKFGIGGSLAVNDLRGSFRCLLNGLHY